MRMGLLDWDLTKWKTPTVFNLELMKCATYYKRQNHIVEMLRRYIPGKYKRIIIAKDYEDFDYPDELSQDEGVTWQGLAVSDNVYAPMNLDIELSRPDPYIYERLGYLYKPVVDGKKIFKMMLKAHHLRLTFDGASLIPNWDKQIDKETKKQYVIIHDNNLTDSPLIRDTVVDLLYEYGTPKPRLGFKFPMIINDPDSLLYWCRFPKVNSVNNFIVTQMISLEILEKLRGTQNITYYFDETRAPQEIVDSLVSIILQALYIRLNGIKLRVKVSPLIPLEKEWHHIIDFINNYLQCRYTYPINWCPYTHCKHIYTKWTQEEKIYYFNFVKEHNPELFDLFYNAEYVVKDHGQLIPHMYTYLEDYLGGFVDGPKVNTRKNNEQQQDYSSIIQPQYIYTE